MTHHGKHDRSEFLTQPGVSPPTALGYAELLIPRDRALSLAWDRGREGVWLEAFVLGQEDMLRCGFPSEEGVGEISDEFLRNFEAGAAVEFFTSVYTETAAGIAHVWFGARRELLVPDRAAYVIGELQ